MLERSNKPVAIASAGAVAFVAALGLIIQVSERPIFHLAILAIMGIACLVIGTEVYNHQVNRSSQITPWMSGLRRYQDQQSNLGWRIQFIPYEDPSKPMIMNQNSIVSFIPVIGAIIFCIGFGTIGYDENKHLLRGATIAVTGLLALITGMWFKRRSERGGWDVAPARCLDRELRNVPLAVRGGGSIWVWRVVCEYDWLCVKYRTTPNVHWTTFTSKEAAEKFLNQRIAENGMCMLRVNPTKPLQTELIDQRNVSDTGKQ